MVLEGRLKKFETSPLNLTTIMTCLATPLKNLFMSEAYDVSTALLGIASVIKNI